MPERAFTLGPLCSIPLCIRNVCSHKVPSHRASLHTAFRSKNRLFSWPYQYWIGYPEEVCHISLSLTWRCSRNHLHQEAEPMMKICKCMQSKWLSESHFPFIKYTWNSLPVFRVWLLRSTHRICVLWILTFEESEMTETATNNMNHLKAVYMNDLIFVLSW